ncbi:MAG: TetR family transcriptional regulator [Deltaproteobacteria bacterium]|nr:TetR family transcriptional regulator [Deltaproteobacteria bacterium]
MKIGELEKRTGFNRKDIYKLIQMGLLGQPAKLGSNQFVFEDGHVLALEKIAQLQRPETDDDPKFRSTSRSDGPVSTDGKPLSFDKKKQIMDKAISLFSKNGFENTKLSDITESLGMAKGTFYLYFKSKKDLLIECISQLSANVVERESWEQLRSEPDFIRRQRISLSQFLKAFPTFNGIHILLAASLQSDDPEIVEKAKDYFRMLSRWLRSDLKRAIDDKAVREVDTVIMSALMLGMAQGLGTMISIYPEYTKEQGIDAFIDLLQRGIISAKAEQSKAACWEVTDTSGYRVRLVDLLFDGNPHLSIELGQGEVQVPCERISSLRIDRSDNGLMAEMAIDEGQNRSFVVDGKSVLSGRLGYGVYKVHMERLSTIFGIPETENTAAEP